MNKNFLILLLSLGILVLLFLYIKEKANYPESLIQFNNYLSDEYKPEVHSRDSVYKNAQSIIEDRVEFDNYLNRLYLNPFEYVPTDSANCFYKIYHDRKMVMRTSTDPNVRALNIGSDNTQAIFIPLDTFLQKVAIHYYNDIDFTNPLTWQGKGYLIYPVNYGSVGYKKGTSVVNNYKSSVIVQFARQNTTSNQWNVIPNSTYNYGDLKPPKSFSGDTLNRLVTAGNICN